MSPVLKNIIAVVAGIIVGMVVNMGIISISGNLVPLPEGVDPSDMESIKANIHLYKPIHFLMPFLAHALGTLTGAYVAARLANSNKMKFALGIGFFFLLGGLATVMMIGGPVWFTAVDLLLAYIPMGWVAAKLAKG